MLVAQYIISVGGEEIQKFLTLLDFPPGKNFTTNGLSQVESDIGIVLCYVMDACMKKAIMEKIQGTLDEKHNDWKNLYFFDPESADPDPLSYEKWLEISKSNCPKVPVIVLFDMGWQKRGHSSISSHTFMIGAQTMKLLANFLYAKECYNCNSLVTKGKQAELHPCPQNYEGSSKTMEADTTLELTIRMYMEHHILLEKQ
eukprot:190572-Ditylum_brightwellii.AAC.1